MKRTVVLSLSGVSLLAIACVTSRGAEQGADEDAGVALDSGSAIRPDAAGASDSARADTGTSSSGSSSSSSSSGSSGTSGSTSSSSGSVPVACYDSSAATTYPFLPPKLAQGKATLTEIQEYLAACLGASATLQSCKAYVGTQAAPLHTNVVNCVYPFFNPTLTTATLTTLPASAIIPLGTGFVGPNDRACRMLAVNAPPPCAQNASHLFVCVGAACETCGTEAELTACETEARRADCAPFDTTASCSAAEAMGAAAADQLCGALGDSVEDRMLKVAKAFCL